VHIFRPSDCIKTCYSHCTRKCLASPCGRKLAGVQGLIDGFEEDVPRFMVGFLDGGMQLYVVVDDDTEGRNFCREDIRKVL